MSVILEAIVRTRERRREWGECLWTAPDLWTPSPPIVFRDVSARDVVVSDRSC